MARKAGASPSLARKAIVTASFALRRPEPSLYPCRLEPALLLLERLSSPIPRAEKTRASAFARKTEVSTSLARKASVTASCAENIGASTLPMKTGASTSLAERLSSPLRRAEKTGASAFATKAGASASLARKTILHWLIVQPIE